MSGTRQRGILRQHKSPGYHTRNPVMLSERSESKREVVGLTNLNTTYMYTTWPWPERPLCHNKICQLTLTSMINVRTKNQSYLDSWHGRHQEIFQGGARFSAKNQKGKSTIFANFRFLRQNYGHLLQAEMEEWSIFCALRAKMNNFAIFRRFRKI